MSIFQTDSTGVVQSDDDGVVYEAPGLESECPGCCKGGCAVCNAECIELEFEDWIGYRNFGLDLINPITFLNGKTFIIPRTETPMRLCIFDLLCPIDETIEGKHYIFLSLHLRLGWYHDPALVQPEDNYIVVTFEGWLIADDFDYQFTIKLDPFRTSPHILYPVGYAVAQDQGCAATVHVAIPGQPPDPPTDPPLPSPFPDALAHVTISDLDRDDCETEFCLPLDGCTLCCPTTRCYEVTFTVPWQGGGVDYTVFMIRHTNDDETFLGCRYSGTCDISPPPTVGFNFMSAYAHIVCDESGNAQLLFFHVAIGLDEILPGVRTSLHLALIDPQPIACLNESTIAAENLRVYFSTIGGPWVPDDPWEDHGIVITLEGHGAGNCDAPDNCSQYAPPRFRQARECGGSLVDLWLVISQVVVYPAFSIDGVCYEFDPAESETPGTILDIADIDAVFESCEECVCPEPCVECNGCAPMCLVGATLTLHYDLTPGECSYCDQPGPLNDCGYCCDFAEDCTVVECDGEAAPETEACPCFSFVDRASCEGGGHDWCCDPDCVDGGFIPSPCGFIDFQGDTTLTYTSFTDNKIHFGVTLTFGSDVVVFDVWFDCADERWYAHITVNTRCVFEGDINGGCLSFTTITLTAEDIEIVDYPCSIGNGSSLTDGAVHLLGHVCPE